QDRGLSAVHILRELDRSLKRLQTDVIDLYIIHWPDKNVPLEVTLHAIETATRQGKIRYFGASNHSAWQLCEMLWIADKSHWQRVVSSQIPYSLLRREFQHDLPFCEKYSIGVTPYQSLQGGLLTGKYRRGQTPPSDSRAAEKPEWVWKQDDELFGKLEAVEAIAKEAGISTCHCSLAFALAQPAISSLIVGVKNLAQIEDAIKAAEVQLPAEMLSKLDAACPAPWKQHDPIRS
ncbi:MAG: aldo/keto reductase, partial [Planctomycetes bacterium]|nr:aldo/keto reductase [Planctomycetota bacterium]